MFQYFINSNFIDTEFSLIKTHFGSEEAVSLLIYSLSLKNFTSLVPACPG